MKQRDMGSQGRCGTRRNGGSEPLEGALLVPGAERRAPRAAGAQLPGGLRGRLEAALDDPAGELQQLPLEALGVGCVVARDGRGIRALEEAVHDLDAREGRAQTGERV